jgi:sugar/nucleoside kinase (ribokinase family)
MIVVLGDLLVDYSMHIPNLCVQPQDLQRVRYLEMGPGGAGTVAIMARHFGLPVLALGELGDDAYGEIVLEGLASEGVDVSQIVVTEGARTPVATVLVDERSEPAYLGFRGSLSLASLPDVWRLPIQSASVLYSDGWVEHEGAAQLILEAFRLAREADVPRFFDPGPGNPGIDNGWHREAARLSTVLLATEEEAERLSEHGDPLDSARFLLSQGPEIVVVKRGAAGAFLLQGDDIEFAPGLPVEARDATGAGDSFAGAVLYGYLRGLPLPELGRLGNATGAAKVQKRGTGHNMPTMDEVRAVLDRFDLSLPEELFPDERS